MKISADIKGLNCASCAEKIRSEIEKLDGVDSADISIVNEKFKVYLNSEADTAKIKEASQSIADKIEPGTIFSFDLEEKKNLETSDMDDREWKNNFKKKIIRIIFSAILLSLTFIYNEVDKNYIAMILIAYVIIGGDIVLSAFNKLSDRQFFDEEFLMSVATFAAIFIGEYQEAVAVMLFYQVGELVQERAVEKSRRSLKEVINLKADYANLKTVNGYEVVKPESVSIGSMIMIKPGESVPLDGVIIDGSTRVNTSALTGESVSISLSEGDEVLSGYINENNTIEVEVKKAYEDSAVAKIMDLVENASSKKAKTEKFITKFSRVYTPLVVALAIAITIIPTIFIDGDLNKWIYRAAIFLVISCPCALVISVPLGFFGGIGASSKNGILVKGGNYLEALSSANYVVMDKTGTLTKGVFKVDDVDNSINFDKSELIEYAAYAEAFSNHPIAKSIIQEYKLEMDLNRVTLHEEISGHGIRAIVDGKEILAGNKKLMNLYNIYVEGEKKLSGTSVYVSIDGRYAGKISISDEIKEDAEETITGLKHLGIENIEMLTGDSEVVAETVAEKLGISRYSSELLPEDKVNILEKRMKEKEKSETVVFVGDGINDAPTLARADIGIAMGGVGSDAAIEAADIVIMTDEPSKITQAIRISRKVKKIVIQNIVFALGVKILVLILGSVGKASMWEAVFADVGVTIIAVFNSIRALRAK